LYDFIQLCYVVLLRNSDLVQLLGQIDRDIKCQKAAFLLQWNMINLDTLALITACLFYHNFSTRKLIQHFLFFDIDVLISIVTIARISEYKEVCLFAQSVWLSCIHVVKGILYNYTENSGMNRLPQSS